jgi:transposase InsO family protein
VYAVAGHANDTRTLVIVHDADRANNVRNITSALHDTFNHAPAITLRGIAKHHPTTTAKLNALQATPRDDCRSCAQGKQNRVPFSAIVRPTQPPIDVISTGTAGSLPRSHDNARYLQIIHDHATRCLLTISFATKSAATVAMHHAIARLQLNTGRKVRRYHADMPANNTRNLYAGSCSDKGQK